jgi:hypothetical protein
MWSARDELIVWFNEVESQNGGFDIKNNNKIVVRCSFMVKVSVHAGILTMAGSLREKNVITPKSLCILLSYLFHYHIYGPFGFAISKCAIWKIDFLKWTYAFGEIES